MTRNWVQFLLLAFGVAFLGGAAASGQSWPYILGWSAVGGTCLFFYEGMRNSE